MNFLTFWQRGLLGWVGALLSPGLLLWPGTGWAQSTDQKSGTTGQDALRLQGQRLFQTRCFVCHGMEGKGDGPAATGLGANPRNFTDPGWQRTTSDEKIRKVIKKGGESVGESSAMAPNDDLTNGQVDALLAFLRSLNP